MQKMISTGIASKLGWEGRGRGREWEGGKRRGERKERQIVLNVLFRVEKLVGGSTI